MIDADFGDRSTRSPGRPWSPLIARNVINLTIGDIVAIAAYAASLPP
jgi:hypothetical protein